MSAVATTPASAVVAATPHTGSSRNRKDKDDTSNPDVNLPSIGNYTFIKTLGEGNFAKVKLAKHKVTASEVAIKVIDKTMLDEKKLTKLYREVRIMKMLHHPHIVKLYEVIETKHTVFLVMEYASGGELYDYLVVHGRMKEKEARAKFRQILSAVAYCHKNHVIHRDLKAENLLLDHNLDIKIADFGFSNTFDPDGKLDTFCGSPPYAAPELFQGKNYVGPEVDIWSLGVILYVLTTGCLPFDGKNLQEMRESVCRGKYRIPFYLSDTCEKLLRKFLIRDPFKRSSMEMLIDDPWINESYGESPIVAEISFKVDEDEGVIRLMENKYHVSREQTLAALRSDVFDDVAAIYYLLFYTKDTLDLSSTSPSSPTSPTAAAASSDAEKDNPFAPKLLNAITPLSASLNSPNAAAVAAAAATAAANAAAAKNGMMRIEEDAVLQTSTAASRSGAQEAPVVGQKQAVRTTPRRRRFTVGGEADMHGASDDEIEDGESAGQGKDALAKLKSQIQAQRTAASAATGAAAAPDAARAPAPAAAKAAGTALPTPAPLGKPAPTRIAPSVSGVAATGTPEVIVPPVAAAGAPAPPIVDRQEVRKRTNTIVGIFTKRRTSDATLTGGPVSPTGSDSQNIGKDGQPRALRFTFNSNTTSTKPPDEIVQEVIKTCNKMAVTHRMASRYAIECVSPAMSDAKEGVKFEIEICKLPRLKNLHGLKFKRLAGTTNEYKEACEALLAQVSL